MMPEHQIDVSIANRFISSLSKSLQALCHGCMDFDNGIEIIGYINVNIDSGSKVDYVLNEKVMKSTTNSMTFVSNSFLAKKEQQKQTRDGACSPVPQLQASYSPHLHGAHVGSPYHRAVPYSTRSQMGTSQKRPRTDDWGVSPKKYQLHSSSTDAQHLQSSSTSPAYTHTNFKQPQMTMNLDNTVDDSTLQLQVSIKKEMLEMDNQKTVDSEHSDQLSENQKLESSDVDVNQIQVKRDPDADISDNGKKTPDSGKTVTSVDGDLKRNFLEASMSDDAHEPVEEGSNQLESDSHLPAYNSESAADKNQDFVDEMTAPGTSAADFGDSNASMSADGDLVSCVPAGCDLGAEDGSQSTYEEGGEGSSNNGQFEVIEIDDEDEDVQAMFGDHHHKQRKGKRQFFQSDKFSIIPAARFASDSRGFCSVESSREFHASVAESSNYDHDQLPHLAQCPHCPETTPWNALKQHISQFHGHEMPFVCSLCGKGFLTSSGLNNHMQAHEGRKFMCPICDFRFKQKGHLKQHLKSIHKLAQCTTCSQTFGLGDEFNQHVLHCV